MRKTYSRRPANKSGKKTMLAVVGIIALLVVLFFMSFWITGLLLQGGRDVSLPQQPAVESAKPTPKPTYEQLEKQLAEKEAEIERLTRELESYQSAGGTEKPLSTASATSKPAESPKATQTAAPTKKPAATQTAKPSAKPTQKPAAEPTAKPTATPTPVPTVAPTKPPVVIGPPNAGGAE